MLYYGHVATLESTAGHHCPAFNYIDNITQRRNYDANPSIECELVEYNPECSGLGEPHKPRCGFCTSYYSE